MWSVNDHSSAARHELWALVEFFRNRDILKQKSILGVPPSTATAGKAHCTNHIKSVTFRRLSKEIHYV